MSSTKLAFFRALDELAKTRPEIIMYDPDRNISKIRELVVNKLKELGDEKHAIIIRKKNTSVIRSWFREWKVLKVKEHTVIMQALNTKVNVQNSSTNTNNVSESVRSLDDSNDREDLFELIDVLVHNKKTGEMHIVYVPVKKDNKNKAIFASVRALCQYLLSSPNFQDIKPVLEYLCSDEIFFMYASTIAYWKRAFGIEVCPGPVTILKHPEIVVMAMQIVQKVMQA